MISKQVLKKNNKNRTLKREYLFKLLVDLKCCINKQFIKSSIGIDSYDLFLQNCGFYVRKENVNIFYSIFYYN